MRVQDLERELELCQSERDAAKEQVWEKQEEPSPQQQQLEGDGGDEGGTDNVVQVVSEDVNAINTGMIDDNNGTATFQTPISRADLDPEDWGIVGKWNIPILIEKKQPKGATTVAFEDTILFVNMETVVNPPEVEVETTDIDFGQSAVGIRMTKMVKIRNKTN